MKMSGKRNPGLQRHICTRGLEGETVDSGSGHGHFIIAHDIDSVVGIATNHHRGTAPASAQWSRALGSGKDARAPVWFSR